MTTVGILAVGLVILWFARGGERSRERAVGELALGADSARVHTALGPPPQQCPAGSLEHLREHLPDDTPAALVEGTLEQLRRLTARRWVYPAEGRPAGCVAGSGATEVGLDRAGLVLWYVPVTGKTPVVLPDSAIAGTP